MKYFRAPPLLILSMFWAGCAGGSGEKEPSADLEIAKNQSVPQLGQGREFWRGHYYAQAVDQYMGQDLDGHPRLLLERGRLLFEVGMFYRALGELATQLSSDLLAIWIKGQERGDMESRFLSCLAAIEAYERGDYQGSISLLPKIEADQAPPVLDDPARLAVAASYLQLGNEAEGRKILEGLQKREIGDPILAMQIYRRRAELGEIDLSENDVPPWKLPEGKLEGKANAGLVDLAWIFLQRGEIDRAFQTLRRFEPRLPLAEEVFEFQVAAGDDLARQFYVVSFLPLAARLHFFLASEDLRKVMEEDGDIGLYAPYLLGTALREAGESEAAKRAFGVFVDRAKTRDGDTDLKNYLEFLTGLSWIYQGSISWEEGRPEEAYQLWDQVPEGEDLRLLALRAASIYERANATGEMPLAGDLRRYQQELVRSNSTKYRGYELKYFRTASMKLAMCLRGMKEEDSREQAVRLLEKLSGYDTKNADPRLLVEMARAYFAHNRNSWSQGKKLITGLIPQADACFPVSEIYVYVLADFARWKPNDIIPGR